MKTQCLAFISHIRTVKCNAPAATGVEAGA